MDTTESNISHKNSEVVSTHKDIFLYTNTGSGHLFKTKFTM